MEEFNVLSSNSNKSMYLMCARVANVLIMYCVYLVPIIYECDLWMNILSVLSVLGTNYLVYLVYLVPIIYECGLWMNILSVFSVLGTNYLRKWPVDEYAYSE